MNSPPCTPPSCCGCCPSCSSNRPRLATPKTHQAGVSLTKPTCCSMKRPGTGRAHRAGGAPGASQRRRRLLQTQTRWTFLTWCWPSWVTVYSTRLRAFTPRDQSRQGTNHTPKAGLDIENRHHRAGRVRR
jgi:hypothetical protein